MRKLTNCLMAGPLAAFLLAELVFLLNPEVPHTWKTVLSVWGTLAITYGLASSLAFWVLLRAVELIRGRNLGPAWLSYRVLTWLVMLALAGAAFLLWYNLIQLRLFIPGPTLRSLAIAATVVTAAASALLVVALFHYSFGRRGAMVSYLLTGGFIVAALALPLIMRPQPVPDGIVPRIPLSDTPAKRRLTILGMEAASMAYVLPAVAEGKLPNFARVIEGGASGALRTLYPTESLAVWTSIATGKLPREHGLKAFYRYRFPSVEVPFSLRPRGLDFRTLDRLGALDRVAVTASSRRAEPFWTIMSAQGLRVGLLRWWGTYPAGSIEGLVVSEFFHRQVREGFSPPLPNLTYPEDLAESLRERVVLPEDIPESALDPFVDRTVEIADDDLPWDSELRRAIADDTTYYDIARGLRDEDELDVLAVYFFGLDAVAHTFTRYQMPDSFGDVSDAEIRKYGRVVETYYRHLDTLLGSFMQAREENETIVVLSGHGMEPLSIARRVAEQFKGNNHLSGYHENAPDGLVLLYGSGVAPGAKIQRASVLDITPTLLYLMGLPRGHDMTGNLLTEALDEELLRQQPVTFISSYKNFLLEPRRQDRDPDGAESALDAVPELLEIPD